MTQNHSTDFNIVTLQFNNSETGCHKEIFKKNASNLVFKKQILIKVKILTRIHRFFFLFRYVYSLFRNYVTYFFHFCLYIHPYLYLTVNKIYWYKGSFIELAPKSTTDYSILPKMKRLYLISLH